MLRPASSESNQDEYSRSICVNASREMFSRVIKLRNFNSISGNCRTIDFLALMTAMTLLPAHMDSWCSAEENQLAHQYHSDRAMIEQVHETMEAVNCFNSDVMSSQNSDLLHRLLAIDVETSRFCVPRSRKVSVQVVGDEESPKGQSDNTVVSERVPYFGIIKIVGEAMGLEVPRSQGAAATSDPSAQSHANPLKRLGVAQL
ncbi:zn2 cys6 dna-binding protein [Colletotrichum incanum]|uniref:Zn2 cys6 dna-binding protein n=1 Tax=Colletotrichum incanum TaxID=1573173 RepID=A0A161WH76_COLIC|nr:zn2 cys6 dna-binding protein [Colletotrichum incanum]